MTTATVYLVKAKPVLTLVSLAFTMARKELACGVLQIEELALLDSV
ncbi:MAG: hypothetical protein WBJ64_09725 [Methanosarcina thermophila]